jgi:hypothetical protein
MLDVCELIVPALSPRSGLAPRGSSFGAVDHELVLDGVHVAERHLLTAHEKIVLGARSRDVRGWTSLVLSRSINVAARHDQTWAAYLALLGDLIGLHSEWIAQAEVDCDQYPIVRESMTAAELLARLDRQRRDRDSRFALVAWPPSASV